MATHFFYYTELRQITPAHWAQLEVPLLISILAIGGIRILTETLRSRLYIMPMSIVSFQPSNSSFGTTSSALSLNRRAS